MLDKNLINMSILNQVIEGYSHVGYGILAAIIAMALLFLIIAGVQGGNKQFTPFSYIAGIVTGAFLTYQFMYLIGAISLKSDCSNAVSFVENIPFVNELVGATGDLLISKVQEYLNGYIVRRILWSIGFLAIGTIAVILTMDTPKKSHLSSRHSRTKFYDEI